MKTSLLQRAAQFYQNRRRKQLWYRVVSGMACVVVFCTVYALILPAITLEKEPLCGLEEHTHTEDCYTTQTVWPSTEYLCDEESLLGHTHDETCYDEEDHLICGYADFVVHTHDDSCNDRSGDLVCPLPEIEEHEHGRECYRETSVLTCEQEETGHIHGGTCYTHVRGELSCGTEEFEGHTHGSGCYETEQTLACTQEEGEGHTHDESCYDTREVLTCQLEESKGHAHTDDCYQWTDVLNCGQEEDLGGHIHSADCYTTVTELVCVQEEIILHTHDESCFDTEDCPLCEEEEAPEHTHPLICGKLQVLEHQHDGTCAVELEGEPEEIQVLTCGKEEHTHTDLCFEPQKPATEDGVYICGLEAHTHDETCYDESGELICGLEEHVHDESCVVPPEVPSYICGKEEHTHDETCYDESGELICGLEEHAHDEICLALPEVPLRELTYEGADYTVTVSFGEDAALPEGVTLSAEEIAPDSEEYQTYYQQTLDTLTSQQTEGAEQVLFARFFDVQFLLDGQVLEPAAPVSVTITYDEPVETGEDVSCQAIHFTEDGPELLEAEAEEDPESGATSFTHTQESFSVVGSLVTMSLRMESEESHEVTFKVKLGEDWVTVGSLPYYYSGKVDGSQRAYITSDMAAKFFGKFGYTAATDPGDQFGYSYNDIYTIFYVSGGSVTNYCMDVKGGTDKEIYDGQVVQLYQSNGTSAQMFRIWDSGAGYSYITPVDSSAYHVNVLGGGTANGTKLGIHTATDDASHWKVVQNSDGTVSFYVYTPDPFLISLPGLDAEDNWIYHVTARPKYDREEVPDQPETVDRKVLKVWEDEGDESVRPESVTVQLLRNGKVYDTVTLSRKNRWSYEWSGLEQGDIWQVVEADVPEEYTVTVSREGITFVVTNTLTEELPDEPTPEGPLPEVPEENIPDEPVPQGPALPQTGVLWWPVPLLACAGMALFLAGWARRRSEECDEA